MKSERVIGVGMLAMLLAACGPQLGSEQIARTTRDLLFLRSTRGVAVVRAGASSPSFRDASAVPSGDWSTVVRSIPYRGSYEGTTGVIAVEPSSAVERWERTVAGNLEPKVVSNDGDLVALGPVGERYYRFGRSRTTIVIAGTELAEPQTIELDGNYEPEAFSTDGGSLFVIKYLPARAPTRYQVRRLDLGTGRVEGVYTPDAELQRAMGGTARIQAGSPDGRRLYTLYTVGSPKDGTRYAFIHVLSLDELWAHCIDLPPEFATAGESATALTVSPDGKRLYVADAKAGLLAEIDTDSLDVVRTTAIDLGSGGVAYGAHDSGSTLYISSGRQVVAIDASTLTRQQSWQMPQTVRGLQTTPDATRVYIGQNDRIEVLDAATGARLETVDPPGIKRIQQLGPVMRSTDPPRKDFVCAC
jgi:hypothetical protein